MGSHRRALNRGSTSFNLKCRARLREMSWLVHRWMWVEQNNIEVQARGDGSLDQEGGAEQWPLNGNAGESGSRKVLCF